MAKDTQILITIPGIVNEKLARYRFWLQDKGITNSKADLIIRLASLELKRVLQEIDDDDDDDNEGERRAHENRS